MFCSLELNATALHYVSITLCPIVLVNSIGLRSIELPYSVLFHSALNRHGLLVHSALWDML